MLPGAGDIKINKTLPARKSLHQKGESHAQTHKQNPCIAERLRLKREARPLLRAGRTARSRERCPPPFGACVAFCPHCARCLSHRDGGKDRNHPCHRKRGSELSRLVTKTRNQGEMEFLRQGAGGGGGVSLEFWCQPYTARHLPLPRPLPLLWSDAEEPSSLRMKLPSGAHVLVGDTPGPVLRTRTCSPPNPTPTITSLASWTHVPTLTETRDPRAK